MQAPSILRTGVTRSLVWGRSHAISESLGVWTVNERVGRESRPTGIEPVILRRSVSRKKCNAPIRNKGFDAEEWDTPETKCQKRPDPRIHCSRGIRCAEGADDGGTWGGGSTRLAFGFPGISLFRPDWLNLDWFFGIVRADGAERHPRGAPPGSIRGGVQQATVSSKRARPVHVQLRSWAAKCLQHGAVDTYEWPARAV
jgi:hypothetical protein